MEDPKCIHVSFHEQAEKTPQAVCLIQDDLELTYAQVQRRVILLAKELKEAGACANAVVAVFMEPSADYVISMLATLSAGAAYVPLELAYPTSMLQRVLYDAAPVAVVTKSEQRTLLPITGAGTAVLCLDDAEHLNDDADKHDELVALYATWPRVSLDDLVFVVYSSGTTGQPKGIANPHRAPALSYNWRFHEIVDYAPGDRVACNVFFVWEALRAVMRGGAVVPIPASVVFDGESLSISLKRHEVTEMLFTPSLLENLFNTMSESDLRDRLASLKTIFLNGEVVSLVLRARCYQLLPHIRFVNLYSISECHEVGAVDLMDIDLNLSTKFCPIGKPCSVAPAYVLDEEEKLVKEGDAGELYIGGDMLAVGYLNLPEVTKTRFVPDPFAGNGRMYRTGDRARILENGQLEILGRCDFMVKIRGYSIVLGAVEAALMEAVGLTSCVVVADGEEGEEKHLIAYLVRAPADEKDARVTNWSVNPRTGFCPEIRRAVDGALPHYMVPSIYIEVGSLPVSAVGAKLDRKALKAQSEDRRAMLRSLQFSSQTHEAPHLAGNASARWKRIPKYLRVPPGSPREDVEDVMATLWEAVLGCDPGSLEPTSDFHENGGHSLSAARLVSLINKVFSIHMTAVQLMQGSTVRKFSQSVIASWTGEDTIVGVGEKAADDERILQQVKDASLLPDDIVAKASVLARGLIDCQTILLTGATGFLGAHVLAEILRKYPKASVVCLVRANDKGAIQKNLERYNLWEESSSGRIHVVKGDLSVAKLGLVQEAWDTMASTVDAIVHCGAAVSLTAPYAMLEAVNVNGTLNIIRLATACRGGTPLVYVSSNGIFPRDKGADEVFLENDDVACLPGRLGAADGYGLSKWAAERLVVQAHKRGLPTMTVRFGNIGWQSTTGIGNALDFQGMILNGSRRMSARPRVTDWQFEVTPVDFAASSLVALADKPDHLSQGAIFNCVQPDFIDADRIFEWIAEVDGATMPALSYAEWTEKVQDASTNDSELSTLQAFTMGLPQGGKYLSEIAHLDCSKFDAALAKLNSSTPIAMAGRLATSSVADYYKTFLRATTTPATTRRSIDALPLSTTTTTTTLVAVDPLATVSAPVGPLAGKVAVVTGASSGIGRAIVLALVQAGCHVTMGARRVGELEKTQREVAAACPGSACKTLAVRTDVTRREDVTRLVQAAEASLGPVDILVNCAGVMYFTLMKNVVWDQWEAQVDVNCKGTMYGIGTVLPKMLERGRGHIVNITSDAGRKAFAGLGVYSGSKFFVEAVSQALRAETASTGLRVTCIQPGNVATPLLSKSTDPDSLSEYGAPTGAKVLEPCDIGRAVVYALSQPEWCAVNEILVEPREEPA